MVVAVAVEEGGGVVVVGVGIGVAVLAGEVLAEVVVQDCENGLPLTLLVTPMFTPAGAVPCSWVLIIFPILLIIDCMSMFGSPSMMLNIISPVAAPGGIKPGGKGKGGVGPPGPVPLPPPKLNVIGGTLAPPGPGNPPPVELPNGIDDDGEDEAPVVALGDGLAGASTM